MLIPYNSSAVADMGDHFDTIDMGRKVGAVTVRNLGVQIDEQMSFDSQSIVPVRRLATTTCDVFGRSENTSTTKLSEVLCTRLSRPVPV